MPRLIISCPNRGWRTIENNDIKRIRVRGCVCARFLLLQLEGERNRRPACGSWRKTNLEASGDVSVIRSYDYKCCTLFVSAPHNKTRVIYRPRGYQLRGGTTVAVSDEEILFHNFCVCLSSSSWKMKKKNEQGYFLISPSPQDLCVRSNYEVTFV